MGPPTGADLRRSRERESARNAILEAFHEKAAAAGLDAGELRKILPRLFVAHVPAGRQVIAAGDTPDFVTVVGSGCIKNVVSAQVLDPEAPHDEAASRITVQFARPGFALALNPIGSQPESGRFGAVAHVDSTVVVMSRELMRDVLSRARPEARFRLVAYHSRVLSRLIFEKCRLLGLGVRERLLVELSTLCRLFPSEGTPGRIELPLSHQDLAELVGASRFAVMRNLLELGEKVQVDRRSYTIAPGPAPMGVGQVPRAALPPGGRPADTAGCRRFARVLRWAHDTLALPQRIVDVLVRGATLVSYEAGERITAAEDTAAATFLVQGAARVMVEAHATRPIGAWIAKPGDFIGSGWVGTRGEYARAFWCVALTPCDVAVLPPRLMTEVLGRFSADQLLGFLGILHDALSRQLYDRCVMLSLSNLERLLYQLHRLALDFPQSAPDGLRIKLPRLPDRDLGALVAIDRSGVSRGMAALQAAGHVRVDADGSLVVVRAGHAKAGQVRPGVKR